VRIAVLGPGGVGGFVAAALARDGQDVVVVAREQTAARIAEHGLAVRSVRLGDFTVHPRTAAVLEEPVDVLVVATKAGGLAAALERVACAPALVLPLLNGLDHLAVLRERFGDAVLAGVIRIESDRPEAGVIVHSSPFLRIDMAGPGAQRAAMERLAAALESAGIPARILDSEAQVMWEKLVRLNALACTTSAWDLPVGEIRDTPWMMRKLEAAVAEGCAVARAEGADLQADQTMREINDVHATLGTSMQRDIAARREPEIDAIPGAVLRAAARHGLSCPAIEELVAVIRGRIAP